MTFEWVSFRKPLNIAGETPRRARCVLDIAMVRRTKLAN